MPSIDKNENKSTINSMSSGFKLEPINGSTPLSEIRHASVGMKTTTMTTPVKKWAPQNIEQEPSESLPPPKINKNYLRSYMKSTMRQTLNVSELNDNMKNQGGALSP